MLFPKIELAFFMRLFKQLKKPLSGHKNGNALNKCGNNMAILLITGI